MKSQYLFLGCLLLLYVCRVYSTIYYPSFCEQQCTESEFIPRLNAQNANRGTTHNRAYLWAALGLLQIQKNFANVSPPSAGRICGLIGTCLYAATEIVDQQSSNAAEHAYSASNDETLNDALDGAGYWVLFQLFGNEASFNEIHAEYQQATGKDLQELIPHIRAAVSTASSDNTNVLNDPISDRYRAAAAGAAKCQYFIDQVTCDGFTPRGGLQEGQSDPTNYTPVNKPQSLAGVTQCDVEIVDLNHWQPACVSNEKAGFGTTDCWVQSFLTPWAGRFTPYALEMGDETTGDRLVPPPPAIGSAENIAEYEQLISFSGTLDDVLKIVTEYWLDSPDLLTPAGHHFLISADAALYENLGAKETAQLLFIVGNAVSDAAIASWRAKTTYDYSRPLQMIQCGAAGQERVAWKGPYQGVGLVNVSEWRPYQAFDFVSPPFAGYTSGHSTMSAAGSEVLKLFFGSDAHRGPSCDRVREGESLFEPKSNEFPGLSDRPNTGLDSIGYSPAEDVVLCWNTFSQLAIDSGISRLYGGVHVKADDENGRELGIQIAQAVFNRAFQTMNYQTE